MTLLVTAARLALALIFIVSAIAKLRDREGSRAGVEAFGLGKALAGPVALTLPLIELLCAVLLLLPDPSAFIGAGLSLGMLTVFTAAIVYNLLRGNKVACHCFGDLGGDAVIGWSTVGRNVAFLLLAGLALVDAGSRPSVPGAIRNFGADVGVLFVIVAILWAAVVGLGLLIRTLVAKYGEVLVRVHELEVLAGVAEPEDAPFFTLRDLQGESHELVDLTGDERPLMLTFVSPDCAHCAELLPDLVEWQADDETPLRTVVVSDGDVAANEAKLSGVGPLRMLLQSDMDVSDAYGILGTPAAVLVGGDGRIAGRPTHGTQAVRDLRERTLTLMQGDPTARQHNGHQHHQSTIDTRQATPGDIIPQGVTLVTEDGESTEASGVLQKRTFVLFWRTTCGFCAQILDDVRTVAPPNTVIVSTSTGPAIRETGLDQPVFADSGLEAWLGVPGTPSAATFEDGKLIAGPVVGGPAVLELLRS